MQDFVIQKLDECRLRIVANLGKEYRLQNGEVRIINASGRSAKAFKVVQVGDNSFRLVYQGADVAPFDSLEYGHNERPQVEDIIRWSAEKFGEPFNDRKAMYVAEKISRVGTERYREPQEWVLTPEILETTTEIRENIGSLLRGEITTFLFSEK